MEADCFRYEKQIIIKLKYKNKRNLSSGVAVEKPIHICKTCSGTFQIPQPKATMTIPTTVTLSGRAKGSGVELV